MKRWLLWLLLLAAPAAAQRYELPCVTGSPIEKTIDPNTGFFRAYICVDAAGNVTSPVFGATGGGVTSFNTRTGAVVSVFNDYAAVPNLTLGDGVSSFSFTSAADTWLGPDGSSITLGTLGSQTFQMFSNTGYFIQDTFADLLSSTGNGWSLADSVNDILVLNRVSVFACLALGTGGGGCSPAANTLQINAGTGTLTLTSANANLTGAGALSVVSIAPATISGNPNFSGTPTFGAGAGLGTGIFSGNANFSGNLTLSGTVINASTANVEVSNGTTTTCGLCLGNATNEGLAQPTANNIDTIVNGTDAFRITTSFARETSGGSYSWTSGAIANATDTLLSRASAGVVEVGSGASASTTGKLIVSAEISEGTKFTTNAGCSETTLVGGGSAGSVHSGTTGACTFTVTMGDIATAPNGWACGISNETTANLIRETASTATSATFSGTTVTGDVLAFECKGF